MTNKPDTTLLVETYRAEAVALFQANQAGRAAAERVGSLLIALVAVVVAAGINSGEERVAIVLPPVILILLSYMFQQYADVSVLGAARKRVEAAIAREVGEHALFYEYAVADIRRGQPLSGSVVLLQWLSGVVLLAAVIACSVIALGHQAWYVVLGYTIVTATALVSAALSYRDMRRAGVVAAKELGVKLDSGTSSVPN